MPRRKRNEKISGLLLGQIEDHMRKMKVVLRQAAISLTPFQPHYDAITGLERDMAKALNLLNDRPADFEEPHHAPFSQSSGPR